MIDVRPFLRYVKGNTNSIIDYAFASAFGQRLRNNNRGCFSNYSIVAVMVLGILNCCTTCGSNRDNPKHISAAQAEQWPPASRSASNAGNAVGHYALSQPDRIIKLPHSLREVSALTDISGHEVGCVQDEDGIIFVYDLRQQKIVREFSFGPPGDYEGLARVGDTYFVLRSDGVLYEITYAANEWTTRTHHLNIPTKNNEGLGFDTARNRLLIAAKSRLRKGSESKDIRAVFAYDLKTKQLIAEPVLKIHARAIEKFAEAHNLELPRKHKKKGKKDKRSTLHFLPSSIAIHPFTQEYFVLSAKDHILAAFNRNGSVTGYARLDHKLFRQPEGITFLSSRDMVISNEGAGKKPTLLFFRWKDRSQ